MISNRMQTLPALAAFPILLAGIFFTAELHGQDASQPSADDLALLQFSPDDFAFFEAKVRPLLAERCYECHAADKYKGQLRLDSRDSILTGGESGPAIVPLKPEESLLVQAVRYESLEMPPNGRLPDEEVNVLEQWIRRGAPWPGADSRIRKAGTTRGAFSEEDRAWWALQPLREMSVPLDAADHWSRNEIDRFIFRRLSQEGLQPAPEANRATLIRRLSFDLTGLPPTPEEVQSFEADTAPQAYEKLVDRLLESPRYGERWARHWLDVVRYADSDGYRADHYRPDAWRYRDYVIRSFNNDKPYDRFVQEQLAGDEMFPEEPDAWIATGFLRHWVYEYNNRDVRGQWDLILNDVTDTTGDVFLGLGLQCAKCHDHKFDPILQKDYYRLRAFFEAIRPDDRHVICSTAEQQSFAVQLEEWHAATADIRAKIAAIEQPYRDKARQSAIGLFPPDIQQILTSPPHSRTAFEQQLYDLAWRQVDYEYEGLDNRIKGDEKEQLLTLRRELARHDALKPRAMPMALTVTDVSASAPTTLIPKKKTTVLPGFLSILDPNDAEILPAGPNSSTTGRRTALAKWLTRADNPLSARVMVNRIWQGHFGRGLAHNTSDFGTLGGPPTHPELLDWLTVRFVRGGWRLKDLHRLIVTSATWRQSSEHPKLAACQIQDPLNVNYWKFSLRRLDAEQIRDGILAVSGQLDMTAGGPGVQSDVLRRSIYLRFMRNERDSLLDVFDLPLFFTSESSRSTTTSPVQSLLLFNSQIMMNHGMQFANSLTGTSSATLSAEQQQLAVKELWQRTFCRQPRNDELTSSLQFLEEQAAKIARERGELNIAAVPIGRLPYRDGQALLVTADDKPVKLAAKPVSALQPAEFTIEASFQIRSVFDSSAVRTLVSKWDGNSSTPGWTFGITGKGSRRKPQTLVMQMFGNSTASAIREAAVFSDQHVELNTPYFAAVSVRPGTSATEPGTVTFHLKNLANDEEQLSTVSVPHDLIGVIANSAPLTIGGRSGAGQSSFDGLLDDVRISSAALSTDQLLLHGDAPQPTTIAFWRFEPVPGLLEDSSTNSLQLSILRQETSPVFPELSALADLCHVLLNSNEFLYIR